MADPPLEDRRRLQSLLRSTVKVMAVTDAPDYEQPWQKQGPTSTAGSGVIVQTTRGLRVLTNSHCVEDHAYVEVRRYGRSQKHPAEVEALGHECDLALLSVEEESFFAGATALPLGPLPFVGNRVQVCGYPIGGDRVSVTQGIVSRIELVEYAQSQRRLLALQLDAAINSGNSGGPVLRHGKLVGIAFQTLDEGESIGYAIAAPVVQHFLADVEEGRRDAFPSLGIVTQKLESPTHRRALGLSRRSGGVLVTRVAYGGSSWEVLQPGDVLLEVDGVSVMADGTVPLREGEMVDFDSVVSSRIVGEAIDVKVLRGGEEVGCSAALRPPSLLVAQERHDVMPSYYLYGGLLFVPLTRDYLSTWSDPWWQNAPRELVQLHEQGIAEPNRTEVVVLQKVLADRVNQGYHDLENLLVEQVLGRPVRSLRHFIEVIESTDEPFVEIVASDGTRIVVDRVQAAKRHPIILKRFGVPADRSPDLMPPEQIPPAPPSQ